MNRTIALAGLGSAARRIHLPAIRTIADLRLVGGYDPVAPSGTFPFPLFSSAEEMLEKTRPDILAVATPPDSHFGLARLGLLAGAHVFCEKPFMNSLEEADQILALARQRERQVVVNSEFRFMNIYRESQAAIGTPAFGDLLFVSASQTFVTTPDTEAGWRGADRRRTCKDFGTHVFDLCRFFFGEDPTSMLARMPKPGRADGPDHLNLLQLEFSGDRVAHITLDRLCRGRHNYLDLRLDGTVGCIETHLGGGAELAVGIRGGTRRPYVKADVSLGGTALLYHGETFRKIASEPADVFAHGTSQLLAAFLTALDHGTVPPCHGDESRRTLALMLAAYESAESGRPIPMVY